MFGKNSARTISEMKVGQTKYAPVTALVVDQNNVKWLKGDFTITDSDTGSDCICVTRISNNAFSVGIMGSQSFNQYDLSDFVQAMSSWHLESVATLTRK